jgi:hypothetical protein
VTNLAGQVGIEYYPLHTGAPDATNAYDRRLSRRVLQQKTAAQGLAMVRVSGCLPHRSYFFRLQETDSTGGQTVWPPSGPLPSAMTAQETGFVIQSRQLSFSLPGLDPAGSIVLLSNSNTPSLLAAVAGDGISSNQVYFSLSDLLDAAGASNYLPLGNQAFTATVLGGSATESQALSLNFTSDFLVGQGGLVALGSYVVVSLGSDVVRAGDSGSVPIGVYASALTNVSFLLNLPTNRLTSLSLQATSPQVGVAQLQVVASNTLLATLSAAPGQTLQGDQEVAKLNYATLSGQASAFVPLSPLSLQAISVDGSTVPNLAVSPGRLVIVNHQPLLEDLFDSDGARELVLYGLPGSSYEIQRSDNTTTPPTWSDLIRVPMSSLFEVFQGLNTNTSLVSYRASEFMADPPIVEAHLQSPDRTLLAYGLPGTNYVIQYSTNLSGVVNWLPLLSYTLTNSFEFFPNVGSTNPEIFYRVKKP